MLQNEDLRAILKKNRYESVTAMLNELDFYNVKQRITYNTVKMIYKAEYKKLPEYLCEMFSYVSQNQPYNNELSLRLPQCLTSFEQRSILFNGVKIYNQMKRMYDINENMKDFKEKLSEFIKINF